MITLGMAGLIAAYVALALLLLSINLYSRWHWTVKAGCIVVVSLFYIVSYLSFPPLLGWPVDSRLPPRFNLVAVYINEPDKRTGAAGAIYLWASALDERKPRAYVLPFTTDLQEKALVAARKLREQTPQLGEVDDSKMEQRVVPSDPFQGGQRSSDIRFYDLPPPQFPDK